MQKLDNLTDNLNKSYIYYLNSLQVKLDKYKDNYILNNPKVLYQKSLERYSDIKESLQKEIIKYMNDKKQLLYYTIQSLKLLNPLNILEQGYSIVKKDNEIVKNTNKININDKLDVTLAKGTLKVKVEEINYERNDVWDRFK